MDDPSIDTTSRTGKLVIGLLALVAEFENDIRRDQEDLGSCTGFAAAAAGSATTSP